MTLLTNNINSADNDKHNTKCAISLQTPIQPLSLNQKSATIPLNRNNVIYTTETIYVEQTTRPYPIL